MSQSFEAGLSSSVRHRRAKCGSLAPLLAEATGRCGAASGRAVSSWGLVPSVPTPWGWRQSQEPEVSAGGVATVPLLSLAPEMRSAAAGFAQRKAGLENGCEGIRPAAIPPGLLR